MGYKQENDLYVKTPVILARVPEYMRLFESTMLSAMFLRLRTDINRQPRSKMRINANSYVARLGDLYEKKKFLACYFTDDDMAGNLCCTPEYIKTLRKKLEKIKLIRTIKDPDFSGYFYILGERLFLKNEGAGGYSVGGEHEGFYIDRWYTMALQDKENGTRKFPELLLSLLGKSQVENNLKKRSERKTHYAKQRANTFENISHELRHPDLDREVDVAPIELTTEPEATSPFLIPPSETIVHEFTNDSSRNGTSERGRKPAPARQETTALTPPIEDKGLNVNTTFPTNAGKDGGDFSFDNVFGFYGKTNGGRNLTGVEGFKRALPTYKDVREAISGMRQYKSDLRGDDKELITLLLGRYESMVKFRNYPRLSVELAFQKQREKSGKPDKDRIKILNSLMFAREDVLGIIPNSSRANEFVKASGVINKLLAVYSYEQITFSIRRSAIEHPQDFRFLLGTDGFTALGNLVKKRADEFKEFQEMTRQARLRKAEAERDKKLMEESLVRAEKVTAEAEASLTEEQKQRIERMEAFRRGKAEAKKLEKQRWDELRSRGRKEE